MAKDKIRATEAADRLAQLAEQLRNGTISLGEEDEPISVPMTSGSRPTLTMISSKSS